MQFIKIRHLQTKNYIITQLKIDYRITKNVNFFKLFIYFENIDAT